MESHTVITNPSFRNNYSTVKVRDYKTRPPILELVMSFILLKWHIEKQKNAAKLENGWDTMVLKKTWGKTPLQPEAEVLDSAGR